MADAEVDIAALSEAQQLALQQYTSVTDQNFGEAVQLLRRCEWNVQIAIARFFDGEPAEPIIEVPPPQSSRREETLANGFSDSSRPSNPRRQPEPAPRVVPTPENQLTQMPPFALSLLLTPANILYAVFSRIFSILSRFFPFLPRLLSRFQPTGRTFQSSNRRPLGPRDTTSRFLREFEEEYGTHTLPFLDTSYAAAYDLAKRDVKFLLVVPISPEHDDTPTFIRSVLLSPPLISFLTNPANNTLLWSGSVQDSETYQVAAALNLTTFPSAALISHTPSVSSTAMSVIMRTTGPTTSENFLARLEAAISQHADSLNRVRASRAEQQAARDLREQQNSAYERSLAQDRERARQRREAQAEQARAEQQEKEKEERAKRHTRDLAAWRRWRKVRLRPEPAGDEKDAVRISLRLLDGERVTRRFGGTVGIEEVYAFVECFDVEAEEGSGGVDGHGSAHTQHPPRDFKHDYTFRLVSPMPRQVYELIDDGEEGTEGARRNLKDVLGRSANLIVERIEVEDELEAGNEKEGGDGDGGGD